MYNLVVKNTHLNYQRNSIINSVEHIIFFILKDWLVNRFLKYNNFLKDFRYLILDYFLKDIRYLNAINAETVYFRTKLNVCHEETFKPI